MKRSYIQVGLRYDFRYIHIPEQEKPEHSHEENDHVEHHDHLERIEKYIHEHLEQGKFRQDKQD